MMWVDLIASPSIRESLQGPARHMAPGTVSPHGAWVVSLHGRLWPGYWGMGNSENVPNVPFRILHHGEPLGRRKHSITKLGWTVFLI